LNELNVEFKRPLSATNPLSPAMFNLPIDAYERGCVREGKVTAVDHTANTISVLIDGIVYPGVPFLYHTDVDYASYVKAKEELPEEDWPVFPDTPEKLFQNSTRCFVTPETGEVYIHNGTSFVLVTGIPTEVLVFSYPEIPFAPENPDAEVVLNKHIAFNIISDFDASKLDGGTVNGINRPTYWPLLWIYRVVKLPDTSTEARLFVYDFNTGGVKQILNEAGDTWINISGVNAASVTYWYNTCILLLSTSLIDPYESESFGIGSVVRVNSNIVTECWEVTSTEWDETAEEYWPNAAITNCPECATGSWSRTWSYPPNTFQATEVEIIPECYSSNLDSSDGDLFSNIGGKHTFFTYSRTASITLTHDSYYEKFGQSSSSIANIEGLTNIIHNITRAAGGLTTVLNGFSNYTYHPETDTSAPWSELESQTYDNQSSITVDLDTATRGFEVFRLSIIGSIFLGTYTVGNSVDGYNSTYTSAPAVSCFVDRPTTQSYANTFTPDTDLTDFINNVVLADESLGDNALASLTTRIIYAPYDIRERSVI
jgi:hypothetical protein